MDAPPPRGALVDIGGRRLHLVRAGPRDGGPLVLLEAGSFGFSHHDSANRFIAFQLTPLLRSSISAKVARSCGLGTKPSQNGGASG